MYQHKSIFGGQVPQPTAGTDSSGKEGKKPNIRPQQCIDARGAACRGSFLKSVGDAGSRARTPWNVEPPTLAAFVVRLRARCGGTRVFSTATFGCCSGLMLLRHGKTRDRDRHSNPYCGGLHLPNGKVVEKNSGAFCFPLALALFLLSHRLSSALGAKRKGCMGDVWLLLLLSPRPSLGPGPPLPLLSPFYWDEQTREPRLAMVRSPFRSSFARTGSKTAWIWPGYLMPDGLAGCLGCVRYPSRPSLSQSFLV